MVRRIRRLELARFAKTLGARIARLEIMVVELPLARSGMVDPGRMPLNAVEHRPERSCWAGAARELGQRNETFLSL